MTAPMHDTARNWIDELFVVLEAQNVVLRDLKDLGTEQEASVAAGRVDDLLSVLSRRQELVDNLLETQSVLSTLTVDLEVRLAAVTDEERHRVYSLLDSVDCLMRSVLERDEQDRQKMEQQRDSVRSSLNELDAGCRARQRYMTNTGVQEIRRFADERV